MDAKDEKDNIPEKFREVQYYTEWAVDFLDEFTERKLGQRFWLILITGHVNAVVRYAKHNPAQLMKRRAPILDVPNDLELLSKERLLAYVRYALRSVGGQSKLRRTLMALKKKDKICLGRDVPVETKLATWAPFEIFPALFRTKSSCRNELNAKAAHFNDPIKAGIIRLLPNIWLSLLGYTSLLKPIVKEIKEVHVGRDNTFFGRFLKAFLVSEGAKLHYYQPGGHMGDLLFNPGLYWQIQKADYFHTYGWRQGETTVPGPAYRLITASQSYNPISVRSFDALFVMSVLNATSKAHYISALQYLTENLNRDRFAVKCIRPRGTSRMYPNLFSVAFMPRSLKRAFIIDKAMSPLTGLFSCSKIVVFLDHPSTGFLEAMYCRHPVVALTNSATRWSHKYEPIHYDFMKLRVLHDSAKSLADFLNSVNIEKWWAGVLASEAFSSYDRLFLGGEFRSGSDA